MLVSLTIENFGSIANAQTLDLRIPETTPDLDCFFSTQVDDRIRLPRVVGVFGPNASGKTTVLRAVAAASAFVVHSFDLAPDQSIPYFEPFLGVPFEERPTRIVLEFGAVWIDQALCRYRYEIVAGSRSQLDRREVFKESLVYYPSGHPRRLFDRSMDRVLVGRDFGISEKDPRLAAVPPNASVIATLAKLRHEPSLRIWQDVRASVLTNFRDLPRMVADHQQQLAWFNQHPAALESLNRELSRLDVGLKHMAIREGPAGLFAELEHEGLHRPIYFDRESHGTQEFIELFPLLYYGLEVGGIVVIDELDANIHPFMLFEVIRWFQQAARNPNNAQLLFTAHNATLLDRLEKEEVVFTEKGRDGRTELFKASDIKGLRREPNLTRKYLGGSLGALPQIG